MFQVVNEVLVGQGFVVKVGPDCPGVWPGDGGIGVVRLVCIPDLNVRSRLLRDALAWLGAKQIPRAVAEQGEKGDPDRDPSQARD